MVALMMAFQAEVHSPLVLTFLVGLQCPKLISVDPTCPTFSLTGEIWWRELRMLLRLTDFPLMMFSHLAEGKPLGALSKMVIQCLTVV